MSVCEDCTGRLTAYLHRELALGDAEKLEHHLAVCGECRARLESLHLVTRNLRKQVLTEPSARVRRHLQERMRQALRPPAKAAEPARPPNEGWHIVASQPAALTLTPAVALPAPAALPALPPPPAPVAPSAQTLPPIALDGPATRAAQSEPSARISARLTARSARLSEHRERTAVLVCVVLALMTALLGVVAWRQLHTPAGRVATVTMREAAARQERWQERIRMRDQDQLRQSFLSRELTVPVEASSASLYLLPHHDAASGETFLALYREEDIEVLLKNPLVDAAAFRTLLDSAQRATVSEGQLQLPAKLASGEALEKYVGAEHRVAVVNLGYRMEIWAAPQIQRYLSNETPRETKVDLPARQGLPPERS